MATSPNPEHSPRLARFVGWALVKNRQLRRDAQALRSALFSLSFLEKRRAGGTSAEPAETTDPAPRRRVSPTATPVSTCARPRRVPSARPHAGFPPREVDLGGATCASDDERKTEKEALLDCETYLRTVGVPPGLPPLRVSYRVPSAFVTGVPGFWRPETVEALPTLHDFDERNGRRGRGRSAGYETASGVALPKRGRRDTVVDEVVTSRVSNASNVSLVMTNDDDDSGDCVVRVSPGARFSARRDAFLAAPPRVDRLERLEKEGGGDAKKKQNKKTVDEIHGGARFTLLMIDPDAPAPRSTRRRNLPGARGPYLHWLVTDIEGKDVCFFGGAERVSYVGPAPPGGGGAHRYAFVLFEQRDARSVTVPAGLETDAPPSKRRRWDIEGFLAANAHLRPKAVSCFYCAT